MQKGVHAGESIRKVSTAVDYLLQLTRYHHRNWAIVLTKLKSANTKDWLPTYFAPKAAEWICNVVPASVLISDKRPSFKSQLRCYTNCSVIKVARLRVSAQTRMIQESSPHPNALYCLSKAFDRDMKQLHKFASSALQYLLFASRIHTSIVVQLKSSCCASREWVP